MSTKEISQSIIDCVPESVPTDNGSTKQRKDITNLFQASLETNQGLDQTDRKINNRRLEENSDSNSITQDLKNVNKHLDSGVVNENVNWDIKEPVNSKDNDQRQSNADLKSNIPQGQGLSNENIVNSDSQFSTDGKTNAEDCNEKLIQQHNSVSSENIHKRDDTINGEIAGKQGEDIHLKEDISELCNVSETNLSGTKSVIVEHISDNQHTHIPVEKDDVVSNNTLDNEQELEIQRESEEQGDEYEDDFEETEDQDNKPVEVTQKENELHIADVISNSNTDTEANAENKTQGKHYEDTFEATQAENNKPKEEPTKEGSEQHKDNVINKSNSDREAKADNEEQGVNDEGNLEETAGKSSKPREEHIKESELSNDKVINRINIDTEVKGEIEEPGDTYEDDFEETLDEDNKTSGEPIKSENELHNDEIINTSIADSEINDKEENSNDQNIEPSSKSIVNKNSVKVESKEKQNQDEEVVNSAEESLTPTVYESDTTDINESNKSEANETDSDKTEKVDLSNTVVLEPTECKDSSKSENVQKETSEFSVSETVTKEVHEKSQSDIKYTSEKENTDLSDTVLDKQLENVNGRSESITEHTSENIEPESNQISEDTTCDTTVDDSDRGLYLTRAVLEGNEKTGSEIDDIHAENTFTKIVVDEEGLPKVAITTVPDRPPSSQASEIENTEDPFSDFDTFTDDPSKTMSETGDVSNMEQNSETDQQKEAEHEIAIPKTPNDNNPVEIKEESDKRTNEEKESDEQTPGDQQTPTMDESQTTRPEHEYQRSGSPSKGDKGDNAPEQMARDQSKDKNEQNNTHVEETNEELHANQNDNKHDTKPVEKPKSPEPVVKRESPLEQLLKRNVEIDGTIDSVISLETNVTLLLSSMKDVMKHYSELLKLQPLKDFTSDLGKFRGDFTSINEAFKRSTAMSVSMNQQLKELRHVTEDVRSQLHRKFQQEDLSTWVDITPEEEKEKDHLQEETYAAEKAAMAKATEARHAVAVATAGVSESHQLIAQMETQVAEAEAVSGKAAAQAHAALIAAEEARKAAEERKRAEEAAKKRAEERARIKAAEEEKKRAEEEITIYQEAAKKGTSVEDEREQFMEEKRRKEEERKNPKNWPIYAYALSGVDFNPTTGCVIRAIDGSMGKMDVTFAYIDQSNGALTLKDNEELISNIISIKQVEEDRKFLFDEPMSIALPVCIGRVPTGKDTVVKQLQPNGYWKELPSGDVQFEDHRETKFVEGRCRSFGSFVVVLRPKKDKLQFVKKGGKLFCSSDSRITFTSKPGTFKQTVNAILEVQTLDGHVVSDLRSRAPAECEDLLTSSSFIKLSLPVKTLEKPLVVTLPLPLVQTRQKRPATGIARETKSMDIRPSTARPSVVPTEDDAIERIYFLHRDDKTGWSVHSGVQLVQPKNKDVATFEISESYERMVLLRTKAGKRDTAVEKMATLLEKMSTQRNVKIILRQRHDDVSDVTIACTTSSRKDRALKYLEDNGFTEGPNPSSDLVLHEGQELYVKFRGNIERVDSKSTISFIYNTNIRATREFKVNEIDEFAQKSLPSYRGFAQVYTKAIVPKPIPDDAPKNAPPEMVEAEILLAELLVELPKPEAEPPKPLTTAPLSLKEGPLTNGFLRQVAGMLGKEWKDVAAQLNLKPMRIQAILRNHVNKDTPEARFDMLVTWAKRVPKAVDKVQILCNALVTCGRQDLAEEVKQRGQQYKQQRFMNARVSHLKQAFVKVAKCTAVFNRWKDFAKDLGVPEEKIKDIEESGGSGQEKCFSSLETWKDSLGEEATITTLSTHLKDAKQERLSREVESVIAV